MRPFSALLVDRRTVIARGHPPTSFATQAFEVSMEQSVIGTARSRRLAGMARCSQ